jgi:hypothetical protein
MGNGGINPLIPVVMLGIQGIWEYSLQLQGTSKMTWHSIFRLYLVFGPIPVAASSMTWVCGRSLAVIAGSNPARIMNVCLL